MIVIGRKRTDIGTLQKYMIRKTRVETVKCLKKYHYNNQFTNEYTIYNVFLVYGENM